jgi:anti-anti-sigma regulatory factor
MSNFHIESDESTVQVRLLGELTIEHASSLHAALRDRLQPSHALWINAAGATRLDAAALQVLVAAARHAATAVLVSPSPAWEAAFRRYALPDPFSAPGILPTS